MLLGISSTNANLKKFNTNGGKSKLMFFSFLISLPLEPGAQSKSIRIRIEIKRKRGWSVADPGYLCRFPDPIFFYPDPHQII
jgi:hypothetical protein